MKSEMHLMLIVALALSGAVAFAGQGDNAPPSPHITLGFS